jgi:hypothetical protein
MPSIVFNRAQHDHGLATSAGVCLGPSALGKPRESSVVAHELFHVWTRAQISVDEAGWLPTIVPRFAGDRALPMATIEEIATDLLAQRLCAQLGVDFVSTYLVDELPADLLERAIHGARLALRSALHSPLDFELLSAARDALAPLCGLELAALSLACAANPQSPVRWPAALAAEVEPLRRIAALALPELAAPALFRGLCRFLRARGLSDRRLGPLWRGDSPLELPGRLLQQRARGGSPEFRESVVAHLNTVMQRLTFLDHR